MGWCTTRIPTLAGRKAALEKALVLGRAVATRMALAMELAPAMALATEGATSLAMEEVLATERALEYRTKNNHHNW